MPVQNSVEQQLKKVYNGNIAFKIGQQQQQQRKVSSPRLYNPHPHPHTHTHPSFFYYTMSTSVAEWDNEYARLARVSSQSRTQGLNSSGGVDTRQLQQHLSRLDAALLSLPLPAAEIQRRRRLIQHLKNPSAPTSSGSAGAGGGFQTPPQQQQQQQKSLMSSAMRAQDDMIDELAVGVSRLRDQTQVIGDEARMHVNLLNDMENNLDTAHAGLESETRRAAQLKEDQSVWRLQLVVAGLSVLLVLLILTGLS